MAFPFLNPQYRYFNEADKASTLTLPGYSLIEGPNKILCVVLAVHGTDYPAAVSVKFGSTDLTLIEIKTTGIAERTEIWGLPVSTSQETNDVVADWGASTPSSAVMGVFTVQNITQAIPTNTLKKAQTVTPISADFVTLAEGSYILSTLVDSTGAEVTTSDTIFLDKRITAPTGMGLAAAQRSAGVAGTYSFSWDQPATDENIIMQLVEFTKDKSDFQNSLASPPLARPTGFGCKVFPIAQTGTEQNNVYATATLHKSSGTDTDGVFYLGNNIDDNFNNIRIVDSGGFSLEWGHVTGTFVQGTSVDIWFKIKSLLGNSGTQDFALYYGTFGPYTDVSLDTNIQLANGINVAPFRTPLMSHGDFQYGCFYDKNNNLVISRRDLRDDTVITHTTSWSATNLTDDHYCASIGVDHSGRLHLVWNLRGSGFSYAYTNGGDSGSGTDITAWTRTNTMTGIGEAAPTYPRFYRLTDPDDGVEKLFFFWRSSGQSGAGDSSLNKIDHTTNTWTNVYNPLFDGLSTSPDYSFYLDEIAEDSSGNWHLSGLWRETTDAATLEKLTYAYRSAADGLWYHSDRSTQYTLPITHTSSEEVSAATDWGQNQDLINQQGCAVDSNGYPHILHHNIATDGYTEFYHIFQDATGWHRHKVTDDDFATERLTRSKIICSGTDAVMLLSIGSRMILAKGTSGNYQYAQLGNGILGGSYVPDYSRLPVLDIFLVQNGDEAIVRNFDPTSFNYTSSYYFASELEQSEFSPASPLTPLATTATFENTAPTASAGSDQSVAKGATVTLDATGSSDPDGTIASYAWTQTAGTAVTLSDATAAQPTFTAPSTAQTLSFQVEVTDNDGATATDTVNITITNNVPVASFTVDNASPTVGQTVTATDTSTDADSDPLTLSWQLTSIPVGSSVTPLSGSGSTFSFTPDVAGDYTLQLTADDGTATDSAQQVITASEPIVSEIIGNARIGIGFKIGL